MNMHISEKVNDISLLRDIIEIPFFYQSTEVILSFHTRSMQKGTPHQLYS